MNTLHKLLLSTLGFVIVGCNQQDKKTEINKSEVEKNITFADFKKIKGVDNVQDVPFELSSKLDSVHFFVSPKKDAAQLKVAYNKLHSYYGFKEFDDFYSVNYSIDNNKSNSIEAFVLKSEFTAAFDLTLKGVNLYEIRSSTLKKSEDFKNKSFAKYGTITEISSQEFNTAFKNKIGEVLVKNPNVKLKDNNWIYIDKEKKDIITQYDSVSTEDGLLTNEYIGRSAYLDLEIFRENSADVLDVYYSFYNIKSAVKFELFTEGYPQILPTKNWITSITNNDDVGVNFSIIKNITATKSQENLLYANFTKFKIADDKNAFWTENDTFYTEVYPLNSASYKDKKTKKAYVKIQLKSDLF